MSLKDNPKAQALLALTTVQVLFGINFISSKIVLGVLPPLVWAAMRVCVSAVGLVLLALILKKKPLPWTRKAMFPLVLYGIIGIVINQFALMTGLSLTTATNSAIINTLTPIFVLCFVTLRGQEPLTFKRIVGFVSAFAGVLVICGVEHFSLSNQTFVGDSFIFLNCITFALFLTLSKKYLEIHDPLWTTAGFFIVGGIGLSILAIPSWQTFTFPAMTPTLWVCMVFSIFGSTLLAYLLNSWALSRVNSSVAALFINLQAVVATLLAWVLFGEVITLKTVISGALIFGGMLLALF